MLGLAFIAVGSFCRRSFASASFFFTFQALSSPSPMSFPHAETSSKVTHHGASPSSPSLPSEGRVDVGGEGLVMPLCSFPWAFLSSRSTLVRQEGWRGLWSLVRCARARFCLLGSFVDWGSRSCFVAADSCYPLCPG